MKLIDIADAEGASGDHDAAERDYSEALERDRKVGNVRGIALRTGNLAALAFTRKDWPQAEALAREALPLSERLGRLDLIAEDCLRLAKALARQGRKTEALPYARRAVDLYARLSSPDLRRARAILAECESHDTDDADQPRTTDDADDTDR